MLISLHLPKTAGSSFFISLKEHFNDKLIGDYSDLPINTPAFKRNRHALSVCVQNGRKSFKNVECIHGHFLPLKYILCKDTKFITWMRDPVERLASHYYFWLRNYDPDNAPPLHKQVVEEEWSLERFCLSKELRNLYHQFLWGFPWSRFDFIGITEYMETELEYFSNNFLGTTLRVHTKNINVSKKKNSYFDDKLFRDKIEKYHSKDVLLYKKALYIRTQDRCSK